ncbi:MAG: aminotransferase class I/II-fold pyridoxal phosphate-dependent enzyme, partial [Gammaproteobacteria bacterium]|nr:aminotransferase class I/II-fold pyridoxal phosphate-dependent enzyme [Gammaproteobacteria bacterium]NIT63829.1 aminotransferase class I/II-fold pyridoxal phosphate-dependent enzyme [Gammaproteobacteria bacterium]NIV19479.1 aminotransferase class I/II-fold pyridoxal phosphate-dependent enzyme [Gammaproteobacteria bacterium]NIY32409.1 aminotransferase class I/II-fold pyridoxal phosphate-dependent enzyme [Gammaproteobacteria bacterium]
DLAGTLPRLRMVIINTPSNPTGYVITRTEQEALLAFCRERGVYLLADEMYERIVFRAEPPPSFLQLAPAAEELVTINGFSKAYAMTGWRLGYLIAQPPLAGRLAQMQEFVTSCAPAMAQVAAITALREGEPYVQK